MANIEQEVKETFDMLQGSSLQRDDFHENMSWDEYVRQLERLSGDKDSKKLKRLIAVKKREDSIEETSLERIMTSNFMVAKDIIDQMTIAKRITMLKEVHDYRIYLYETLARYGAEGLTREEQLTAGEFKALMGRVKHLEILLNWLYGIV